MKEKKIFWICGIFSFTLFLISHIFLMIQISHISILDSLWRNIILICLISIMILLSIFAILFLKKGQMKKLKIIFILFGIFAILGVILSFCLMKVNSYTNIKQEQITYTSIVLTLQENDKKLQEMRLGVLDNEESYEGYIIPLLVIEEEKLKEDNIVYYDSFIHMMQAIIDGEIDGAFFPNNYQDTMNEMEELKEYSNQLEIIYSKSKSYQKKQSNNSITKNTSTEPFTILIMGIDSVEDSINTVSSFNGDALLLITFNPQDLRVTMLSIPRDTYVPIACFKNQKANKITHAAWYGEDCMIETIQNFTDIPIDYYVKLNFKGVVDIVDAVGGIEVDVPFSFCEQDSKRRWDEHTIFVEEGKQVLNGEQVLALARHRQETSYMASYCGQKYVGNQLNDIVRGNNQQLIIKGLLQKIKTVQDFQTIDTLFQAVQKNIDTNFPLNQILPLYETIQPALSTNKDITNVISIQKLHLSGYDQYIYDDSYKMALYNYMYYEDSLKEVVQAMKENLNLTEREIIKDFSYSINESYEEKTIGKGSYTAKNYIQTMPDFVGKTKNDVETWAKKYGYKVNYTYEEKEGYPTDQVLSQNYPYAYILKNISNKVLEITLSKKVETITPSEESIDCTQEEMKENSSCLLPDFTGWTIEKFDSWYQNLSKYNINMMSPSKISVLDNSKENNTIFSQSKEKGTLLKDIVSLEISYYIYEESKTEENTYTENEESTS